MVRSALLLACLSAQASSVSPRRLPCGWQAAADAAPDASVTLRFVLQQSGMEEVRRAARDVSNPRSSAYGQHLSREQLQELVGADSAASVKNWLEAAGATTRVMGLGSVVEASLPASAAAKLLQTSFKEHVNEATGQRALLASEYSLPTTVGSKVSAVFGLHGLPLPLRSSPHSKDSILAVTPKIIQETYNIAGVTPGGKEANRRGVVEFQGKQQMNSTDLTSWFDQFVPGSAAATKSVHKFIGSPGDGKAGVEAALDIEYLMGMAPGVLTDFYYYKNVDFCSDLIQWTSELLDEENPPLVHSVSYGYQGDVSSLGCDADQVDSIDKNFAKLAARGITLVISSGDSGSGYDVDCYPDMRANNTEITDGTVMKSEPALIPTPLGCCTQAVGAVAWTLKKEPGHLLPTCYLYSEVRATAPAEGVSSGGPALFKDYVPELFPSWPASSPWVTSVGGTRFAQQTAGQPEVAVDQFGSGGGFSTMFEAFEDQKQFTAAYLAAAPQLPPKGSYPPSGRGTPDVSALGEGYQTLVNGVLEGVGGTSASAPAFAAMVSLLNEARLAAGKPAMGYLNPFLYQHPDVFTDVTEGTNAISRVEGQALLYGFNCTKGWDPVTGLGTPKFDKMLEAAMAAVDANTAVV